MLYEFALALGGKTPKSNFLASPGKEETLFGTSK